MSGPLRFSRSLAPKLVVGGLFAAATGTTLAAGSAPIPPCSPDGVCLPNYESWGWYQTRWRPFPGDSIAGVPTAAEEGAEEGQEDTLRGPELPTAAEEGQVGPESRPGGGSGRPAPTLPTTEGPGPADEAPPEAGAAPGADGAEPPVDVMPQPGDAAPDALPDPTAPIDPFGAAPPPPPAWMIETASFEPLPAVGAATPTTAGPTFNDAPNMLGDDAPPALPADLQDLFGAAASRPTWLQSAAAPIVLAQPANVRAAHPASGQGVVQTSAEMPLGIHLINPASAVSAPADAAGLQQAIYFEASDLDDNAVALPPVTPAN